MKEKVIYERESRYFVFGKPRVIRLIEGEGKRNYIPQIKNRDKLILIEIEQAQRCPHCKRISVFKNRIAYGYKDQERMWAAVFDAKVLPREKRRQVEDFKQFMRQKLEQLKLDNLYDI